MIERARQTVIPAYVGLCLVLGGSSAAGILANLLLQLLAIPIICWAILTQAVEPPTRPERQLLILCGLTILTVLLQLIPLPPEIWTALPGRDQISEGYVSLGQPLPWIPVSLMPYATIHSGLSLLPPLAVVLGMIRLRAFDATWLFWVVGGVAAGSVFLGTWQMFGGENSGLYPYGDSSYGAPTGFFANTNHLATLLVVSIPMVAALYARARDRQKKLRSSAGRLVLTLSVLFVTGVGLFVNWSFAGLALAVPVAAASLAFFSRRVAARRRMILAAALFLLIPLTFIIFLSPVSNSADVTSLSTSSSERMTFVRLTLKSTKDFFPWGSGGGTFEDIYPLYEDPAAVDLTYVNNAHNDYLQLILEYGAGGAILLGLFFIGWFQGARRSFYLHPPATFAYAATVASGAILAHSLVDYPLRTAAVSVLLAACCSIMASHRSIILESGSSSDSGSKPNGKLSPS